MLFLQAWRSWRSAKGVALLAAGALAAGIGSATAIYTVVNAVMLKPLPYQAGERFVALFGAALDDDAEHYSSLSVSDAKAYQERTQAFDAFGWFREAGKNLTFAGEPHHVQGVAVTVALVRQLGIEPRLGQWFRDEAGVVLSTSLWQRLGGQPDIVGKPLTLDGRSYTVTGVMPARFHLPVAGITSAGLRTDVWTALDPKEDAGLAYFAYARRKPGVTFAAAEADVKRVAAAIAAEDTVGHPGYTARLFDLRETVVKDIRPTLLLLFAAAGLLFLITCADAAGLLLARAVSRVRETAMRVALGAGRGQLARHYLAESLPIALAGALGGVVISLTLTPAIVAMAADVLPRADDVAVDWTVLMFALGAACVATLLSSLAPLWQAVRTAPADVLGDGARVSAGVRSQRVSYALVVGEIALAFALLAVSAVLIVHLRSLSRTSTGFDPDGVLTFVVSLPGTTANDQGRRVAAQRRLVDAVRAVPGVDEVGFANQLPLNGCCISTNIYPEGRPADLGAAQRTSLMAVSPGYFRAMRVPLARGRLFVDTDVAENLAFVLINQAAARRHWGDRDPLGAYGRFINPNGSRFQVVGVVGDVKNDGLGNPTVPEVYVVSAIARVEAMNFVVRSARPAEALVPEVRRAIRDIDPEQPIHDVATMRQLIGQSTSLERTGALLTAFFAGAALLLATLGIYGVVSYAVRQRTVEIGTRMALGASREAVLSLIVGRGLTMTAFGVIAGGIAGVAAAVSLGRVFGIHTLGPPPFIYSTGIVATVAFAASFLPAWRASLLSPMVAIRNEPGSMWEAARRKVRSAVRDLVDAGDRPVVPLGALITEFAAGVRRAASFSDATDMAISTLRERIHARSIALLEKRSGAEYRSRQWSLPVNGFLDSRLRHYPHPIALTDADFAAWLRWAGEFRPEYVEEIERLRDHGSRLAVALRTRHEIVGLLLLSAPEGRDRYTPAEKEIVRNSADVFALMIENAGLTERALEQEKLRRDLALAGEVQRRLLPSQPPQSSAVTLAAFTLPARTVGGDYYDFLDFGRERIGIAVADVSGKGIAAALLMSVVQASLRVISAERDMSPAQLAARMNGFLHQCTGANKYATFVYAQLEDGARRLRYVNAGHNPPYLVRAANGQTTVFELNVGGTVLGLFPEVEYEDAVIDLSPGDLLVAFTDGVSEALNPDGEEFGEERLKDFLRELVDVTADEIASRLTQRMREWIGYAEQHDDLTFVVAVVNERPVPAAQE